MRYLYYTNYLSGDSGLSNGIMSIEIGVVLAFLTKRLLLLDGNRSPPANIVSYGERVDNRRPSRVTDLIEIPIPWKEPREVDLSSLHARELTDQHLHNAVFFVPGSVDIDSPDARSFANRRTHWLCESDELLHVPVLRVSEDPVVLAEARKRTNLGFYSYFFYLDPETRRAVYRMLQGMQAKEPLAKLALRVANDLGRFNAVHMRRGDFKHTYGVTVLDRHPWEAIEALDNHFSRDDPLLICTDEREDPFFDEIKAAYKNHVFVDHHILDNYGQEFRALPNHDCIALAYLSQLVAAESQDFIGTMTSTFTAIIQRYRGNRGKDEPFKFLWNELPEPGGRVERGRHAISDCVPLDRGIMVEEFEGPYSWNRYNPLINPGWMREWPESFLSGEVLATGRLSATASTGGSRIPGTVVETKVFVRFDGLCVEIHSDVSGMTHRLSEIFNCAPRFAARNVVARYSIDESEGLYRLLGAERVLGEADSIEEIQSVLIRQLVGLLTRARVQHLWFDGMAFQQGGQVILYAGDAGDTRERIADMLCSAGWELLGDRAIPVRSETREITPFVRSAWPRGAATRIVPTTAKLSAVVVGAWRLHRRDSLTRLSPAVGLAQVLGHSFNYHDDREDAMKRLCKLMGEVPVYELSFSDPKKTPNTIGVLAERGRADAEHTLPAAAAGAGG